MKIILQERIENLGILGEIINVKPGYARNFLIPYGKAAQATKENIAIFERQKLDLETRERKILSNAKLHAKKISGETFVIKAQAGDSGKLFGSVGSKEIAHAIKSVTGISIEKRYISIPNGVIRHLGKFQGFVHLHNQINVEFLLIVEL